MHVRRSVEAQQTLNKKDAWESHKEMVDRFGEEELEAHTWSGRVIYRQDPSTPGVWQYKDTQCWSSNFAVKRGSQWEQGAEMECGRTWGWRTWKMAQRARALEKAKGKALEKAKGKAKAKLNNLPLKTKRMKRKQKKMK